MNLNEPVSVIVGSETIELNSLDIVIIDDNARRFIIAKLAPFFKPLILWMREDYDNIGDWTQSQAESRILELMGNNPEEKLQSLVL